MIQLPLPLTGLCAHSGTGKTTLLTQLIPLLIKRDLRIGVIKHAHHKYDIDTAAITYVAIIFTTYTRALHESTNRCLNFFCLSNKEKDEYCLLNLFLVSHRFFLRTAIICLHAFFAPLSELCFLNPFRIPMWTYRSLNSPSLSCNPFNTCINSPILVTG